jgi:hypothetical protein
MRISEERDRREREKLTLERLPLALEELHEILKEAVKTYTDAFGADSVDVVMLPSRSKVTARDQRDGKWTTLAKVEVSIAEEIPGFRIDRGEYSGAIEVGLLPSKKLYYRDREQDVYLTMDELTKRILDRVLFPKLRE